jgi:hypothetical protein
MAASAVSRRALRCAFQSSKSGADTVQPRSPAFVHRFLTATMRSARSNGSGRSRTASTTLKIAVVDPIPSASVTTERARCEC